MAAVSSAAFASEVEVALEEHRTSMSSAEAQKRLLAILMAAAFIADQMRELPNAQIEDGVSLELQSAMEKLTVPQLTDSLNRMLEAHASLLDDKTSAELMKIFGCHTTRILDPVVVPACRSVERSARPSLHAETIVDDAATRSDPVYEAADIPRCTA
jgi:hypothetical protein